MGIVERNGPIDSVMKPDLSGAKVRIEWVKIIRTFAPLRSGFSRKT